MLELHLIKVLQQHLGVMKKGAFKKLQEDIREASKDKKAVKDRVLRDIISGKPKSLRISDLEAIDSYLRPFGEGLADVPFFDADGVLRDLVAKREVVFLIANRITPDRSYTSVWDVRAFNSIVESIDKRWPDTRVRLKEGIPISLTGDSRYVPESIPEESDCLQYFKNGNVSFCCLGAPLSSRLSEYMLAKMFGVRPFTPPVSIETNLPFYFVWRPPRNNATGFARIPSHFSMTVEELRNATTLSVEKGLLEAITEGKAQAFVVKIKDYEVRPVWLDKSLHQEYSIIVAQKLQEGEVWVVVAGLSGPGTYAAAKLLYKISIGIPDNKAGDVPRLVYSVVESTIKVKEENAPGDAREVIKQEVLVPPQIWPA
jgi:hypothetical protein